MASPKLLSTKQGIREDIEAIQKELAPMAASVQADARETLRNLSLTSGGLATGALVLLGSGFKFIPELIVAGTSFFLLEVLLTFGYLLHWQSKDGKHYLKLRKDGLIPSFKVLNLAEDAIEKKITEESFFSEAVKIAGSEIERVRKNRNKMETENPKLDHWDKVFIIVLGTGVVLIFLGMILPVVCPSF